MYSSCELRCAPQKGKKIINWAKIVLLFLFLFFYFFHQPSTWFDLTLNYREFPSFFLFSHTFFSDGVHNKTTLFLFVASLLHTLILLPSSPVPSSPRLALMFSVFNHCSTALFALSLSLSLFLPSFPLVLVGARKETSTTVDFASTPTLNSTVGKWSVRMF